MRLRVKLILMAIFAALFPAAGWRFVVQMEDTLRQSEESAMLLQAGALARAAMALEPGLSAPLRAPARVWLHQLGFELSVDGYLDDWGKLVLAPQQFKSANGKLALDFLAAQSAGAHYLWFSIGDLTPVWADSFVAYAERSDHIQLTVNGHRYRLACNGAGPAAIEALDAGAPSLPNAFCQVRERGYMAELKIPRTASLNQLGFRVLDFPIAGADLPQAIVGTLDANLQIQAWPTVQTDATTIVLAGLAPPGMRLRILDSSGMVLRKQGALLTSTERDSELSVKRWLRAWVYRALLAPRFAPAEPYRFDAYQVQTKLTGDAMAGNAAANWRPAGTKASVILSAAVPLLPDSPGSGILLLEKTSDALLIWTNRALGGLLLGGMAMMLIAASALFGYAGWLSYRVRKLKTAAENALTPEGKLRGNFPRSRTIDEVGDLSRSFAKLLDQVGEYNEYLRTLASKLSHELSTPLAVVRSSLENLEHEALTPASRTYTERARSGAERLTQILRAMSEATRMERAIAGAESERFDVREVLLGAAAAYRDLANGLEIACECPNEPTMLTGAPELIHQALDKLVDNARSFAAASSKIVLKLSIEGDVKRISVFNAGSTLPDKMRDRLFDSLISMRDAKPGQPHLGLGLYIVRLIAELHGGSVFAENVSDTSGVPIGVVVGFNVIAMGRVAG